MTEVAEVCFEVVYDLGVALGSVGPAPLVGIATELSQVIQPAQGTDEFNQPDPGNQFVAALFVVTDTSSTDTTSDDADNDAIVIGSDSQTYTADFDSVSECTNFNGGGYASTQGSRLTGRLVFQAP